MGMADLAAENHPLARSARGICCCAVVRRVREGRRGRRRDGCMIAMVDGRLRIRRMKGG